MTTPLHPDGAPAAWKRFTVWLERWAEAMDFDIASYHEERIARLETEVAVLRGRTKGTSEEASAISSPSTPISRSR